MNIYKDKKKFDEYIKNKEELNESQKKTYVFYSEIYKSYKIGYSCNPEKRIKEIIKHHGKLDLIFIINSSIEIELHRLFKDKNVAINNEREWFKLSTEDLSFLRKLNPLDQKEIKFYLQCYLKINNL